MTTKRGTTDTSAAEEISEAPDRFARYRDLVDTDRLKATHALVVGVGAVGRQVALQLATMGMGRLTLIDFDRVGPENFGVQGYRPEQDGSPKADATASDARDINPDCAVWPIDGRFKRSMFTAGRPGSLPRPLHYVFCCVDDMDVRRVVLESMAECEPDADCAEDIGHEAGPCPHLFLDSRMAAEYFELWCVPGKGSDRHDKAFEAYINGWFPPEEMERMPCTMRSTFPCAVTCAGMMTYIVLRHLRDGTFPPGPVRCVMPAFTMSSKGD